MQTVLTIVAGVIVFGMAAAHFIVALAVWNNRPRQPNAALKKLFATRSTWEQPAVPQKRYNLCGRLHLGPVIFEAMGATGPIGPVCASCLKSLVNADVDAIRRSHVDARRIMEDALQGAKSK